MYPAGAQETHRYLNDVFVLDLWPTACLNGFPVWDYPVCAGTMPPPRESHAAVVCQVGDASTLIIHGGSNGYRLGDLWMLNLDRMQWSCPSTAGDRPLPRSLHSACWLNGQFVVFGGWVDMDSGGGVTEDFLADGPCQCINCFACLDIDTMTWRSFCAATDFLQLAPRPRSGHSCVVIGSRMYIFSGRIGCKWLCSRPTFAKDLWFLETEVPRPPACVYLVRSSPQALEISWTNLSNADAYVVQVQKYDMPSGLPGTTVMMSPSLMTEGQSTSFSAATTVTTTMGTAKSVVGAGALLAQAASAAIGMPREGIVSIRPDLQPRIGRTTTKFAEAAVTPTEVRLACVPTGISVRPSIHMAQNLSLPGIRAVLAGNVTTGLPPSGTTVPPVGSLVRLVGPATPVLRLPPGATLAPAPSKGLVTASGSGRVAGIPQQQVITLVRAAQPATSLGPGSAMVVSGVAPPAGMIRTSAPLLPTVFALPQPRSQSTSHIATTVVTSCGQQGMLLSSVGAAPLMAAGNQFIFAGSAALAGGQQGVLLSPICSTQVMHSAGQQMIITSSSGTMPAVASGIMTVVHQPAGMQQRSLAQASGAGPVMFLGSHGTPALLSISSPAAPPGVTNAVAVSPASTITLGATLPSDMARSEGVVSRLNTANNDRSSHRMVAEVKSEPIEDIVLSSAPTNGEPSDNSQVPTSGMHGSSSWCVAGIVRSTTMTISRYYPMADVNVADSDSLEDIDVLGDDDCSISLDGISIEPGVAYKIRVAGVNSCGRGQWSGIVAFRTSLPGLPGAPASVKISKTPDGALLSWDPPPVVDDDSSAVTEYAAFLAVNKSGPPKASVQSPQMAFVRVYCGPSHHCTVLNSSLQSAFVDSSQPKNVAVIFRISARNHKGYGPAAHVRWLVGQDLISSLRTSSNALIKPASNRLLQPTQGAVATQSTGLVPLSTTSLVSVSAAASAPLPSMASLAKAQTSNVFSPPSTTGLAPLPTMASLAKAASAQTSLSTELFSSRLLSLPHGVPSVVQRTIPLASAAIPASSASPTPAPAALVPGDRLMSVTSVVIDDATTAPATKRRKPDNV